MMNNIKRFGQFVNEREELGAPGQGSPQVGDDVYVAGFADDAGVIINSYAGYGKIIEANDGLYAVAFDSIFDSAGADDNGPEEISFREKDIVSGERGIWAVVKHGMQFE
jgi:hypothetical protein